MTNIIYPREFHAHITSASLRHPLRSDTFSVQNVRRIAAVYAPVPAWITRSPLLNKAVTTLREIGWRVDCYPDQRILCFHPSLEISAGINIVAAMQLELAWSGMGVTA